MKITLVRHAQVIKEYQGKYNGHIDIGLSSEGFKDAKRLALKLKDIKFDKVYCSDLLRARQTLSALQLKQEVIFTKDLREKSWGIHEGKSFEEIEKSGLKYQDFEQWINALDGENMDEYMAKIKEYFYKHIFKQKCENILVVTHSGVIKTLLSYVRNISIEEAFSISFPYSSCITIISTSLKSSS